MSRGKNFAKNLKTPRANLKLKEFVSALKSHQRKGLAPAISTSNIKKLRPTVYLSSGGKFSKYLDFLRFFTYKAGFVPIHPIGSLGYYVSSMAHDHNKLEVTKDCFSLMLDCNELWVFDEKLPTFETKHSPDKKHISEFPEGVLAEIYFWLTTKPNSPIRFFTWADANIPKYIPDTNWALIAPSKRADFSLSTAQYPMRFGIIDLGSSTVKLTVCSIDSAKEVNVLHKKAITVNLVEGFFDKYELQPLAMDRTVQAVYDCQSEALSHGVTDIKLVGTGTIQKAVNLNKLVHEIKEKTDLRLEVLSGKDEARLIFKAVISSFSADAPNLAVMNVGGSTTKLVIGGKKGIKQTINLPLGISDLNEKFCRSDAITSKEYKEMKAFITKLLKERITKKPKEKLILVHTGGELDYMIVTGFPLEEFAFSFAHPKKLSLKNFKKQAGKMRKMKREELRAFMPANPRWMDGAIGSNTIAECMAEFLGAKTIVPSNKNLNDGILLSMIE